jgi:hypothetical protein
VDIDVRLLPCWTEVLGPMLIAFLLARLREGRRRDPCLERLRRRSFRHLRRWLAFEPFEKWKHAAEP